MCKAGNRVTSVSHMEVAVMVDVSRSEGEFRSTRTESIGKRSLSDQISPTSPTDARCRKVSNWVGKQEWSDSSGSIEIAPPQIAPFKVPKKPPPKQQTKGRRGKGSIESIRWRKSSTSVGRGRRLLTIRSSFKSPCITSINARYKYQLSRYNRCIKDIRNQFKSLISCKDRLEYLKSEMLEQGSDNPGELPQCPDLFQPRDPGIKMILNCNESYEKKLSAIRKERDILKEDIKKMRSKKSELKLLALEWRDRAKKAAAEGEALRMELGATKGELGIVRKEVEVELGKNKSTKKLFEEELWVTKEQMSMANKELELAKKRAIAAESEAAEAAKREKAVREEMEVKLQTMEAKVEAHENEMASAVKKEKAVRAEVRVAIKELEEMAIVIGRMGHLLHTAVTQLNWTSVSLTPPATVDSEEDTDTNFQEIQQTMKDLLEAEKENKEEREEEEEEEEEEEDESDEEVKNVEEVKKEKENEREEDNKSDEVEGKEDGEKDEEVKGYGEGDGKGDRKDNGDAGGVGRRCDGQGDRNEENREEGSGQGGNGDGRGGSGEQGSGEGGNGDDGGGSGEQGSGEGRNEGVSREGSENEAEEGPLEQLRSALDRERDLVSSLMQEKRRYITDLLQLSRDQLSIEKLKMELNDSLLLLEKFRSCPDFGTLIALQNMANNVTSEGSPSSITLETMAKKHAEDIKIVLERVTGESRELESRMISLERKIGRLDSILEGEAGYSHQSLELLEVRLMQQEKELEQLRTIVQEKEQRLKMCRCPVLKKKIKERTLMIQKVAATNQKVMAKYSALKEQYMQMRKKRKANWFKRLLSA